MVACGEEPEDPYIEDEPCLVVEVPSPSSQNTDRREKLMFYRQIPSVEAYLIVHQEIRQPVQPGPLTRRGPTVAALFGLAGSPAPIDKLLIIGRSPLPLGRLWWP